MTAPVCGRCRWAYSEDWPKGWSALRCGCRANGVHYGHVTSLYPTGKAAVVEAREAPAWCRRKREVEGK